MSGRAVDYGQNASDYRRYRAGFPESFFDRMCAMGLGGEGVRLIDLGTGTGTIARGMARRGCHVTGVDRSDAMLSVARELAAEDGVCIDFVRAPAERTGLDGGIADVVVAGQCWHWFERPAVGHEIMRLLRPGGTLVIAHFDWTHLPGEIADATERLMVAHNPSRGPTDGTGLYVEWLQDVGVAGFVGIETFSYDEAVCYSHEAWRGRIRASAWVLEMDAERVSRFDAAHAAMLRASYPDPVDVPHRVWAVVARKGAE